MTLLLEWSVCLENNAHLPLTSYLAHSNKISNYSLPQLSYLSSFQFSQDWHILSNYFRVKNEYKIFLISSLAVGICIYIYIYIYLHIDIHIYINISFIYEIMMQYVSKYTKNCLYIYIILYIYIYRQRKKLLMYG